MTRFARSLPGLQGGPLRGAVLSLEACRGATVSGKMGVGKTLVACASWHAYIHAGRSLSRIMRLVAARSSAESCEASAVRRILMGTGEPHTEARRAHTWKSGVRLGGRRPM